jgi:hypothetical protein
MIDSILKKLAVITAGTALIFAVSENMPTQAAQLTYNFFNTDKTLTGTFSFDQAAVADDQQVTIAEGLNISANYGGQSYTQANDSGATVLTNFSGEIANQEGLGLQFVIPDVFAVYSDNFIDAASVQTVTYTSVPEPDFTPALSVFGLGLFLVKKTASKWLIKKA